jgi:AcrR family transcriptional regulator
MTATPGLRERKKRRTRESIAAAAHRLFVEHGYHATTLPDIAEAADVSTRTIFAYFPSKEDILFSGFAETIDDLAQALAHRPAGVQTLDVVRDFILSGQSTHKSELDAQLYVCITDDPTLRSHLRARIAQI